MSLTPVARAGAAAPARPALTPAGPAERRLAQAAPRPPPDEPLDRRLLVFIALPARDERLPVVHALRPAQPAALDRHGELPLHVRLRPSDLARGPQHAVDHRRRRSAAGAVRVRHLGDARARTPRRRLLPHGLLSAGARSACRGGARLRLPPQSGDRPCQHAARQDRHRRAALVQRRRGRSRRSCALAVGDRQHDGDLPRCSARRARAISTSRRSSTARDRSSGCAG